MKKDLSQMTKEELWRLFPIELKKHDPSWKNQYEEQKRHLIMLIGQEKTIRISHIGSTAVEGIIAKPIIDILLEAEKSDFAFIEQSLTSNGWICMSKAENRISFNKGYTPYGFAEKVYHLHLRVFGDCDEIFFRDYLNRHPAAAKAYEELKLSLAEKFRFDRDGYTAAKGCFINKIKSYSSNRDYHIK